MFRKKGVVALLILVMSFSVASGQPDEFCNAISTIMRDAPNKFRNIRGNVTNAGQNATSWSCGIKVPGTINSRFVASLGLFYEGAFYQSANKDGLKAVYERYKKLLTDCLSPQGYSLSLQDNFFEGVSEYKKVVLMPEIKEGTNTKNGPPHVTMEVTYSKQVGFYTVVVYIFEH